MVADASSPLRILHFFRSPVGGIFRHVRDLVHEQVAAGHAVGIICDNNTGGTFENEQLATLSPHLSLGLHRQKIARALGPSDVMVAAQVFSILRKIDPDILHTHGAKGGAIGRITGTFRKDTARLYCPHGGSIHYDRSSLSGRLYFGFEKLLEKLTDHLVFVSDYERDGYLNKVGQAACGSSVVHNGLTQPEFQPIATHANASDFIYVGMMRDLKGPDILLAALHLASQQFGRELSLTLVGDGPDLSKYKQGCIGHANIRFLPPMPARDAFGLGKVMVVPSRAESLPYIVLEALAAGRPLIATEVGGIPEIYEDYASQLVRPDSETHLVEAMVAVAKNGFITPNSIELAARVQTSFSAEKMANGVMNAYREALNSRLN